MLGKKYPVLRALKDRDLDPEWLPQTPSWMSRRIVSPSLIDTHFKLGMLYPLRYSLPLISVYRAHRD